MMEELARRIDEEIIQPLSKNWSVLADTRIGNVRLYDHLVLTAGLAVALVQELRHRGYSASEICGAPIADGDLLPLARSCGLLHDIGKDSSGDYSRHVSLGVAKVKEYLKTQHVAEPVFSLICGAVACHHMRYQPKTLLEKAVCIADSYSSSSDRPELGEAWTPGALLRITRTTLELEEELFGSSKPLCLLLGDVDAVKAFLYESSKLPEIRGGSEMLVERDDQLRHLFGSRLAKECLIYCGGGGFLAVVPASEADTLRRDIEQSYLERTPTVTTTIVVSQPLGYLEFKRGLPPYDDESVQSIKGEGIAADLVFSHFEAFAGVRTERKGFGELVATLTAQLQRAKREKALVPFFFSLPVHRRCMSCGKRPASELDRGVFPAEWLCKFCWEKRQKGRPGKRSFADEFKEFCREKLGISLSARPARDLDSLSGEEGRIAFLYADGNNMGDLLQQARTAAAYRHISEALGEAVKDSLFWALNETFGPYLQRAEDMPFEIVVVGGDEAVIIVPASYGWVLAVKMLKHFETHELIERLREGFGRPMTISVGLVFADLKYPMHFVEDLAEDLIREAKRLALDTGQSTLCHLWLRSSVASTNAKYLIDTLYRRVGRGQERWLTARPFTRKQSETLIEIVQRLSLLSASQRKTLADAMERSTLASLNLAFYQTKRMGDETRKIVLNAFGQLGELLDAGAVDERLLFWRVQDGVWRTALLDALELAELGIRGGNVDER